MAHRRRVEVQDQRQHRQLGRHRQGRRRAGEAAHRRPPRRRHRHGPLDRRQHRRHPPGDHRRLAGADRHRADLPDRSRTSRTRPTSRRSMLLDMVEHQAKQGVDYMTIHAGVLLEYLPLTTQPHHRHRQPRRLADGRVDDRPPPAEPVVHALRRAVRDHAGLRRDLQPRRRPAARLPRRRQRRGPVRRAEDARRADAEGVGARLPGDDRGAGAHPDAPGQDERREGARAVPRGPVLRARPAGDRHRPGLRPHHQRHRRGPRRRGRGGDALLRHAEGAPRACRTRTTCARA